ncbi:MAG: RagB/SusD family nutrient uptake outer membrane protein [Mariniphaga sp.]|nr:RagB/SusD family nutrient uptake outer membrane protein [Mariniphaga sp.]
MKKTIYIILVLIAVSIGACKESYLEEKPLDKFSPENLLVDKAGFESVIHALHVSARDEELDQVPVMATGTDIAVFGAGDGRFYNNYKEITPTSGNVNQWWDWAYTKVIKNANLIITRAENPAVKWTDEEKNAIVAEAKFFRAYAYNSLVNLYGGVPIVDKELTAPRYDFVRASRLEVLKFIESDLDFAVQYLPNVVTDVKKDGRIFKAAAYHLLSEVCISLGKETGTATYYDKSITSATKVIDGTTGNYKLMTSRFGDLSRPGDAFSDLFWTGQQNRASGNLETIWALQYEYTTPGGGSGANVNVRWWGPKFEDVTAPDGKKLLVNDSLGRSQGGVRPNNYYFYDIWNDDWNDMRNSKYNIRRTWIWNNPTSPYLRTVVRTVVEGGKMWVLDLNGVKSTKTIDTMRVLYPQIRKIEGLMKGGPANGRTDNDQYRMRLAETYLLRAEAYFHKGDLTSAAADINVVRTRAKAKPATSAQVTLDYILDERARELTVEEHRRKTLCRLGVLVERVKRYSAKSKDIEPYHQWFPIPQKAIDANRGAKLSQNPGYPGAE